MEKFTGFVEVINSFSPQGKSWTAYSMKVQTKEGEVLDKWFQLGFDKPAFDKGAYVSFSHSEGRNGGRKVEMDTLKVAPADKTPPKPASPEFGGKRRGSGGSRPAPARAEPKVSERFGQIGGYNTEDDVSRMCYANSRDHAIKAVDVLLSHDALVIPKATTKAGQADRYDIILGVIDKLTERFYFASAASLRNVAAPQDEDEATDEVVDELPDVEPEADDSEDPFGDDDDYFGE